MTKITVVSGTTVGRMVAVARRTVAVGGSAVAVAGAAVAVAGGDVGGTLVSVGTDGGDVGTTVDKAGACPVQPTANSTRTPIAANKIKRTVQILFRSIPCGLMCRNIPSTVSACQCLCLLFVSAVING